MTGPRRRTTMMIILLMLVAGLALIRMVIDRPPGGALTLAWPDERYAIFRWKSVGVACVVGASLAVSGVLLQALLRNPLASPFILGVSSGAGLGVMAGMYVGWLVRTSSAASDSTPLLGFGSTTACAMIGGIAVLGVVYFLGHRRGVLDPLSLVLVGVVISAMCAAGMMILELLVPHQLRGDLLLWMMGRIDQGIGSTALLICGGICIAGMALAARMGRAMDAATFGDDEARSMGLNLPLTRALMFIVAGALAASTVAIAGPIGFVGLIAPHGARLLVGPRHTLLTIAAGLAGMGIVLAADAASAAFILPAGRIPVGVFTAILGGPAFIWLLKTGRGQV